MVLPSSRPVLDAQYAGVGERVAGQALDDGHRQRRADEGGDQSPRHAQGACDQILLGAPIVHKRHDNVPRANARRPEPHAGHQAHHQQPAPAHKP
jgi:hypothetical protein